MPEDLNPDGFFGGLDPALERLGKAACGGPACRLIPQGPLGVESLGRPPVIRPGTAEVRAHGATRHALVNDRRRRLAIQGALGLLVVGLATWLWARGESEGARGFVTEPVDRGPIAATVTATGTVNPVTTVQVGTYVSGPIRAIDVDFNSPVAKGQRVAKIDPAQFQVRVDQAAANLATARARVAKSRADLGLKTRNRDRNRVLRARDLIAQQELDAFESDHAQAVAQVALDEAGVQQVEAALSEAKINLSYTDIVSPVDGVVVSRNVDVGQTVAASFQTPTLFQIAQYLTQMQVNSNVSESDIGTVKEGQPASFSVDAYPGRVFEGRVAQVRNAPLTVQNVVTYDVVVQVDNSDLALKPGMTATVEITTDRREDVLRLPVRALRFKPDPAGEPGSGEKAPLAPSEGKRTAAAGPAAVWVLEDSGEAKRVEVRIGLRDDRHAEVLEGGLAPGDAVAISYRRVAPPESPAQRSPLQPPPRR